MSKNLVIISRNNFPNGDAGAIRDLAFAKIYEELGYNVYCICLSESQKRGKYKNVSFISIRTEKNGLVSRIKAEFGYKTRMKLALEEINNQFGHIDVLHIVDIPLNAIYFLKKYAIKNNCRLVHDSVEWYSASNFKYGKLSFGYINKNLLNLFVINSQFQVITISKYLKKHFNSRGINTLRIPVIMDVDTFNLKHKRLDDKVHIVYAGSPGKKDYLKEIILGINMLDDKSLERLEVNIIGVNEEELLSITDLNEENLLKSKKIYNIYGRMTRDEVVQILKNMDFSVLLRPPYERYTKAGFPTKLVESLSNGVPMICNITSDLDDYLCDMKNSVIVEDCSAEAFKTAIERVLSCNEENLMQMKRAAFKTANENFNYKKYITPISKFMN